jgi:DNA polymerase I-like protein with 3'-5' exonuclease and polymerase domains
VKARADDVGLFWEDLVQFASKTREVVPRVLPAIPDTGWTAPTEFPRLDSYTGTLAVDVETKDLDLTTRGPGFRRTGTSRAHVVGIAIGTEDGGRWYFPMRHEVATEQNLNPDAVLAWARQELCRENQPKVGANIGYDVDALWSEGVPVTGPFYDVQYAEALLDEYKFTYNLESLAQDYFGEGKVRGDLEAWIKRAYGSADPYRANIWRAPPCLVGPYAQGDVDLPLRLLAIQRGRLKAEGLLDLFHLECDLVPMVVAMRQRGVRVNLDRAKELDDLLTEEIDDCHRRLKEAAGFDVNINTATDLARMFDKAGVQYPRTEKGAPSFRKEWLLHTNNPLTHMVTQVRTLEKYRNTFIRGYILDLHVDGRVYCQFHQLRSQDNGTVSGRFSSSLPNLQNIPSRDDVWGPRLRSIFIPEEGCDWTRHDWSQIEYRFLAHVGRGSNAEVIREEYRNDPTTDFHKMVMRMTGLDRKPAKTINFGLVYGMGPPTLARQLGMTMQEAEDRVFTPYHSRVPFVRLTYDTASDRAKKNGYVKTILGRRARFTLWQDVRKWDSPALPLDAALAKYGDGNIQRAFTHKALNRVLQGSSADLMKLAMRDLWRSGVIQSVVGPPHVTVHDELGHSVPRTKEGAEAKAEIKHTMETCLTLSIPIKADEESGPSWGEVQ